MKFITFSKLRGRIFDIKKDVETLSSFIYSVHQKNSLKREISPLELKYILKNIISNLNLKFYDYLKDTKKTIEDLAVFIIEVKRNNVNIDELEFDDIKKEELITIFNKYNKFLEENNLADIGDIEKFVFEYVSNNPINEVKLDNFEFENIHFFSSKLQRQIYYKLNGEILKENIIKKNPNIKEIECFNEFDEAVKTLKIIKNLLNNGEKEENIKIFVSNIDKYFPILETLAYEYKINLYSTKGISIAKYKDGKERIKRKASYLYKKLKEYGVSKKDIIEDLIKSETILIRKGIEVTETNQIFVYKDIKHLFFIGANIDDFPPTREKNIFYVKDFEEKFFKNNLYKSSVAIFNRMKEIADNLYIAYQKDKKSTLIEKYSKIEKFTYHPKIINNQNTKKEKLHTEAKKLSASKINTYNKCPRRYFYQYILYITPPEEEIEEMEITLQGEIMHKCFEIYVENRKQNKILGIDELIEAAYNDKEIKEKLKNDIYEKLYKIKLRKIINNFIDHINEEIKNFKNSLTEELFCLDENLEIIDKCKENMENYFIKGFIDRIDIENNLIKVWDYKFSDSISPKDISELKNIQLPLYVYYARKKYKKSVKAYLITFKKEAKKFVKIKECNEEYIKKGRGIDWICYNNAYENKLKNLIFRVKENIENGEFKINEPDCEYCPYVKICDYKEKTT